MKCPRCDKDLRTTLPGESGSRFVVVDVCAECNGAWFDRGEIDSLDDNVWVDAEKDIVLVEADHNHEGLNCPKCGDTLQAVSPVDATDLVIDRCARCEGFWLDKGELDKMQDVAAQESAALLQDAKYLNRPAHWSRVRWLIYKFNTYR